MPKGFWKTKTFSDNDRITASIILFVLSFAVILTVSFLTDKRQVRQEEIIVREVIEETERENEWDELWEEEEDVQTVGTAETSSAAESIITETAGTMPVNVNTASKEELEILPGIGEKLAEAIIEYRENTPFRQAEDVKNVDGIGEKKFEAIKDMICV